MRNILRIAVPVLLIVALLAVYFWPGSGIYWRVEGPADSELNSIGQAWEIVTTDYVDAAKLDKGNLSQAAIRGMIEALHDPYSGYLDPQEYEMSQTSLQGSFGGIGAEVRVDPEGQLRVVAPIVGTPAEKAGILPGDKILEINGESTQGMSSIQAVVRIRGEPGTTVTLRIQHEGEDTPKDLVITREQISVTAVVPEMLADNIAYLSVNDFSGRTAPELLAALESFTRGNATGIILDLRDNPGGFLNVAVDVASQFLKQGTVTYVVDGEGHRETYDVKSGGIATDLPMAVLVNGHSASASEILAGVLQDYGRARIIGTRTLGKGSVNQFAEMSDGSAIYITIARWYTPNGRQIEGQGITPDDVVEMTPDDIEHNRDPQLDRAIEYIKSLLQAAAAQDSRACSTIV